MVTEQRARTHWPVVIAGAGPVGMTLAAELGSRGVETLVVEQAPQTTRNPRCNTTNARSMEYFRRLGIADEIRRAGLPLDHASDVVYCTSVTGRELHRFRFSSSGEILDGTAPEFDEWPTPEPQHRVSQIFLEPILAGHLAHYPSVTVRRGHRVVAVRDGEDAAEVDVAAVGAGGTYSLSADYLVGCDGGASVVRRGIGSTLTGDGRAAEERLSVYFRSTQLAAHLGDRPGWMYWWYSERLRGSFLQLDGRELFLCHARVPEGTAPEDLDEDEMLRAAIGEPDGHPVDVEKLEVVRWTPRRLVADRFRGSRVVLAGDAAHLWLPLGGFGMNTGIADAVGLGWRLAAVLRGWGGERLLADYETERRSVGEATSRAALKIDRDMRSVARAPALHDDGPDGDALRAEAARIIEATDRQQWYSQGVQFGTRYRDSPGVAGQLADSGGTLDDIGTYLPSDDPGARFPHAWLEGHTSVFDRLGRDLTLVRVGAAGDPGPLVAAAAELGVPLDVVDVPAGPGTAVYRHALVLVRPDLVVAWRGDAPPEDARALLRTLTGTDVDALSTTVMEAQ
ncbi:FAD-dependent monooxygenase [Pseudonocardia nematodicida]|uniref:FAD-dependent monooxygenase n=1 Tax=Pseudonocardia nematodicida TaxID=1206997 RepID=A0ABV1K4T7_9PSEU